jgi:hypothetical protein
MSLPSIFRSPEGVIATAMTRSPEFALRIDHFGRLEHLYARSIPPAILKRTAIVYVRQSSPSQVRSTWRANDANMTWWRLPASAGSWM